MIHYRCSENGRNYRTSSWGDWISSTIVTVDNKFCINVQEVTKKDMLQITELSEEAKVVIRRNIEARQQSGKFVKLQPGKKKVLLFVPEKTEQVEADFNGNKSLHFRYNVLEEGSDQEKYFEVSKNLPKTLKQILFYQRTQ